jgi:hypothetical protein
MPNPLTKVKADAKITFSYGAPAKNPELCAQVLMVLSAWGKLDTEMGVVFASFLNTQAEIGVAIYNQLTNLNTQDAAMRAAASLVLDKNKMDLFLALMKIAKGPRDQRNQIAHGVWGYSEDLPDALLLLNPKIALKFRGQIVAASEFLKSLGPKPMPDGMLSRIIGSPRIAEDVWVYRQTDFDEVHKQLVEAIDLWSDFARFIWGAGSVLDQNNDRVEEARRRLFGQTAIRETIDRSRAKRGESPLPPL